ncbi:hypothetical protein J2W35_004165 [Variovorax boronicumulans]|uniref:hypothetical protein n=1 Tax=Variovorax boronicumulans TaxID=436515 RepID=UPI002789ABD9|nr:hypothetical protein [Variovorax boronicumulans]MDQ0083799.1 hypothetical protein [Variovorax boronicumulans]
MARQLEQMRQLQKIRKVTAAIELAMARSILLACERRVEAEREALVAAEEHVIAERRQQAVEIVRAPRSVQELHRWRRGELSLLDGIRQRRERLTTLGMDRTQALEEVQRRWRRQRQLAVGEEKFSAMIDSLAQDEGT